MTTAPQHLNRESLEAGLDTIRESPKDEGVLRLIVRRPEQDQREVLDFGELSLTDGLVGDNWKTRGCPLTEDGAAHPEMQLNIMNARAIALIAQDQDRWPLAGDQLYIDFDLSDENLPPGTRLTLGGAVVEVTAPPHNGCAKFKARFGADALQFVNSPKGKILHLRGINAKVVESGTIRVGDTVRKADAPHKKPGRGRVVHE